METNTNQNANRRAAINTLAVVGFIALVIIGMALAVYAARYVPKAVSRIGSAAVSLSQVFSPAATSSLEVVDQPTTVSFGGGISATSTIATTTTPATTVTGTTTKPVVSKPTGYTTIPVTVTTGGSYTGPLYGLPNLVTTITGTGYLDNNNNFVQNLTVPANDPLAVKFTITNAGTNTSGTFHLSAVIPTRSNSNYTYTSDQIRSLNPGENIQFTLHLGSNEARTGNSQIITITADSNNEVAESNETNSATITYNVQ